jgi:hypothetical protein
MIEAGLPPHASLKAAEEAADSHTTTSERKHDAPNAQKQPLGQSRKRSGRQLSAPKASREFATTLREYGILDAERVANAVVTRALPEKQREAACTETARAVIEERQK